MEAAARDPAFLELYDSVMARFDVELSKGSNWCGEENIDKLHGQIAYFSAEYAIHNSLPIYAWWLGGFGGRYLQRGI